jgi:hypothetical protein
MKKGIKSAKSSLFLLFLVLYSPTTLFSVESSFPNPSVTGNSEYTSSEYTNNNQQNLPQRKLDIKTTILFSDLRLYQLLDIKKRNFLFVIKKLKGLNIAYYPKIKFMLPTIDIKVHPEFLSKVIFDNYRIVNVISSSNDFKFLKYTDNVLFLQPNQNFLVGNLEVFLQNDNGNKKIVELMVKSLDPYTDENKVFYTSYLIIKPKLLDAIKVLEYYKTKFGHYPDKTTTIDIGGIVYKIYVNPPNPNVSVGNFDYYVKPLTVF